MRLIAYAYKYTPDTIAGLTQGQAEYLVHGIPADVVAAVIGSQPQPEKPVQLTDDNKDEMLMDLVRAKIKPPRWGW